ncbi:uncharacterized protein METZ01_LOCUS173146 [marine metagenome]|uniref:1-deoxy-D-xylulose-5-phosphate reductoisomerase n=1 Tax=marine metagenome TaxID=408172 RepID=A0A382C3F3_9ZZZZ
MKNLAILGSTGSVGTSTLKVVQENLDDFSIFLLSASSNKLKILKQISDFKPRYAFLDDKESCKALKKECSKLGLKTEIVTDKRIYLELITNSCVDAVVAGMVGIAGLEAIYHAVNTGKRLLLANKESYVVAGEYFNSLAEKKRATIFPLDSEHSAIHQCLNSLTEKSLEVFKVILTGSGGPFLNTKRKELINITPKEALSHPIWNMGKKISIDSATMMNKGLEIIEAKWLFNLDEDQIDMVIHPEGIVHSLIELKDGSSLAHLSLPDMKIPIAYALGFPKRINSGVQRLSLAEQGSLTFLEPDFEKFPCIQMAKDSLKVGGTATAALNAANEVAVNAFLNEKIPFTMIPEVISHVMDKMQFFPVKELDIIFEADYLSRKVAKDYLKL